MFTKNVKISIVIVLCVLVLVFGLIAFFLFFNNEKPNNSVDAATVTETYVFGGGYGCGAQITFDNSFGAIIDVTGHVDIELPNSSINELTIEFSLNSNYRWGKSSVTIDEAIYTRSGNFWITNYVYSVAFAAGKVNIVFPIEDLVEENFTSQTYSINYNLNGGSYGSSHPSTYSSSTSSQTKTVSRPSRTGYTFSSWSVSGAGASISGTTLTIPARGTGNITLTANWSANTYYIVYNGNGATSGSMTNTTCRYGSTYTLTANAFVRTGYNFMGWATSENGAVAYGDRASINNLTSTNGASFNLYAVWEIQSFTVSVLVNDNTLGEVSSAGGTYTYGTSISLIATPNAGATFIEWVNVTTGETFTANPLNISVTSDLMLQARFAANTVIVLADVGGEVRMTGFDLTDNNSIVHLSAVAYKGYEFAGWVVNDGTDLSQYGITADIPYILIKGKTVTAHFVPISNNMTNPDTDNGYNGDFVFE